MSIEEQLQEVKNELEKYKRRFRCLIFGGVFLLVGLFLLVIAFMPDANAQSVPVAKEIRAERFVLTDSEGNPRAFMGESQGGYGFVLIDESQIMRVGLAIVEGNPGLSLLNSQGEVLSMYALVEGKPGLVFVDGKQRIRIFLGFGKNDEPVLDFYDETGRPGIK